MAALTSMLLLVIVMLAMDGQANSEVGDPQLHRLLVSDGLLASAGIKQVQRAAAVGSTYTKDH